MLTNQQLEDSSTIDTFRSHQRTYTQQICAFLRAQTLIKAVEKRLRSLVFPVVNSDLNPELLYVI